MDGMDTLGRPKHLQRFCRLAQAEIQRPEVGVLVGAAFGQPGQSGGFLFIARPQLIGRNSGRRLDGHLPQSPLIEQEAAPARRQLGVGFAGVI